MGEGADAHEQHDGVIARAADGGDLVVRGDDGERGRDAAVGEGDAGDGRHRDRTRHAGDHLDVDAVRAAMRQLLQAAAEHVRIAALQPHDLPALAGELDEQRVDGVLRHGMVSGSLADVDDLGGERVALRRQPVEDRARAEAVGHDDVGLLQGAQAAQGEQAHVAGTGADERDPARRVGRGAHRVLPASRPRLRSIRRSSGAKTTSSTRMPMARITRIVASTPARSASCRL